MSNDTPLAAMYAYARILRLADGPDEVHRGVVARIELAKYKNKNHEARRAQSLIPGCFLHVSVVENIYDKERIQRPFLQDYWLCN